MTPDSLISINRLAKKGGAKVLVIKPSGGEVNPAPKSAPSKPIKKHLVQEAFEKKHRSKSQGRPS